MQKIYKSTPLGLPLRIMYLKSFHYLHRYLTRSFALWLSFKDFSSRSRKVQSSSLAFVLVKEMVPNGVWI